jgi:hypothetical protein
MLCRDQRWRTSIQVRAARTTCSGLASGRRPMAHATRAPSTSAPSCFSIPGLALPFAHQRLASQQRQHFYASSRRLVLNVRLRACTASSQGVRVLLQRILTGCARAAAHIATECCHSLSGNMHRILTGCAGACSASSQGVRVLLQGHTATECCHSPSPRARKPGDAGGAVRRSCVTGRG